MKDLKTPLKSEEVKKLKVGDEKSITGAIFTARDAAHKKLLDLNEKGESLPINLGDFPCFHCGPVMKKENGEWKVVSAGPTTSVRMEIFESEFIDKFGIKILIGKGGMGNKTLNALEKFGAVYCKYTGEAGSLMADAVKKVNEVYILEELGIPEAVWVFQVDKLGPLVVTMDSKMNSLHDQVRKKVQENLKRVKKDL